MVKALIKKFFLLFFFISNHIFSSFLQEKFSNLYIPQAKPEFYFFDQSPIYLKDRSSYFLFVMKWQQKINLGFLNFFNKLYDDIHISVEDIIYLFYNKEIIESYQQYLHQKYKLLLNDPETVTQENIKPYLRSFLEKGIKKYIEHENVSFLLSPKICGATDICFDINSNKFIICFNSNIYNLEKLRNINNHALKKSGYYFYIKTNSYDQACIAYSEFLNSGFIMAASFIHHQLHLILFTLINCTFLRKKADNKTIFYLKKLIDFQIDLETILQSNNPLESALFYSHLDKVKENNKIWNLLIKDITNIYDKGSLIKFEQIQNNYFKHYTA